jgi:hypothetical protein
MWINVTYPQKRGSENGIILRNEEYKGACLITLEKCPNYYAITCGVYGAMVHTVFCGEEDHDEIYEAMKEELAAFIDRETTPDEEDDFYDYFINKYF